MAARNKTSKRFNLLSAGMAFALWGGWSYLVNRHAPGYSPIISALAQGAASFVITLLIVRCVSWTYAHMPHGVTRLLAPPVLTISATGSLLFLVHSLVGTLEIATTITLPLLVAFGFAVYTTVHIHRQRDQHIE